MKPGTFLLLLALVPMASCQSPTKQQTGAVIGGIAGGILGNQIGRGSGRTAAVIGGTLIGSMVGGSVGADMDQNDRYRTQQTLESNRTLQSSAWVNPDSGARYQVTPTYTYETSQGPCREYQTEALINGRRETVYGKACRQPDGSWRVMH